MCSVYSGTMTSCAFVVVFLRHCLPNADSYYADFDAVWDDCVDIFDDPMLRDVWYRGDNVLHVLDSVYAVIFVCVQSSSNHPDVVDCGFSYIGVNFVPVNYYVVYVDP